MNRFLQSNFRWKAMWMVISGTLAATSVSGQTNSYTETDRPAATNSYWIAQAINPAIYDTPYHISLFKPKNGEDGARAWSQTKSIFVYGFGVIAVLAALPEESTGWENDTDVLNKWLENVTAGPEWDRNSAVYNYVGHTYFGGVYYQVVRKSGYRQWDAFVYTFLMSTFYWEYGIESLAEVPSIQDLIFTPIMGWVYGEWAYQTELRIRNGNGEVGGSKILGGTALFLLDPVDSLGKGVNWITGRRLVKAGYGYFSYNAVPIGNTTDHQFYLHMKIPIGAAGPPEPKQKTLMTYRSDPVDTGIVGIALGTGHTFLDKDWGMEDDFYTKVSMGIYLTPRLSTRLAYAWGDLTERATGESISYENYSLDAQYYLNTQRKLRPFVTAGFGEQLWDKDDGPKTFQWNAGIGLHYRFHSKWALQADWINYYSPSRETYDHNVNAGLVYRFGRGEHDDW